MGPAATYDPRRMIDDRTPDVEVFVDVIRKTSQGYMVTPIAMIPMGGKVRDDSGLDRVAFTVGYSRVESSELHWMPRPISG